MKRRTAIRLYQFLIAVQVLGFILGSVQLVSDIVSGVYKYLPAYLVGAVLGSCILSLLFRQVKQVKATTEDQWNRAWHIQPYDNSQQ